MILVEKRKSGWTGEWVTGVKWGRVTTWDYINNSGGFHSRCSQKSYWIRHSMGWKILAIRATESHNTYTGSQLRGEKQSDSGAWDWTCRQNPMLLFTDSVFNWWLQFPSRCVLVSLPGNGTARLLPLPPPQDTKDHAWSKSPKALPRCRVTTFWLEDIT